MGTQVRDRAITVREARALRGMTRERLAVAAGVSMNTIANVERGASVPRVDVAKRIAEALGLTLDALDFGKGRAA